ncbi:unnamed protein product [Closterium sp. NIES-54]
MRSLRTAQDSTDTVRRFTRLPDSLRSVTDHFLSLDPSSLTIDLLEQHLLAAKTSAVAVGAARGTLRTPFFEGCSPSPLAPSYASATSVDVLSTEDIGVASTRAKRRSSKGKGGGGGGGGSGSGGGGSSGGSGGSGGGGSSGSSGGSGGVGGGGGGSGGSGGSGSGGSGGGRTGAQHGGSRGGQRHVSCPYVIRTGDRAGQTCGKAHTQHHCFFRLDDAWRAEFGDEVERPRWDELLRSGVDLHVYTDGSSSSHVHSSARVESVHTGYRASSGSCVCTDVRVRSGSTPLLVSPPVAQESSMAPPPGSPLPATPSWHALPSPCLWSSQVSASPPALACPALPPLRRGVAARRSSLLLVYPDECSSVGSPHGMWGPTRVRGQGRERYFLLVVDDYTRYTTVFPLRSKGQVVDVLIPWICSVRLQLRERFGTDLPVLRLHFDRGGEFSSNLLRDFCRGEGSLQSFTLPDSPQQNGIAECRIGLVMEVARASMIHAAAPHFLWPFAVGDASVFRVWGSRAFVCYMNADKLSARAIPFVFLGFPPDAPGWQFYHPTSRRVFPSQDVTFDESVPFYHLFPYRSAPPPPPPLFLAPGPPPIHSLPPQGPAPSGVSHVDPLLGTTPIELGVAESEGAEPEGVEPGGAELEGAEYGGAEPQGAALSGATGAGGAGAAGAGGDGVIAGASGTRGTAAIVPRGARTRGTGAAGTGSVGGAGAGDPKKSRAAGAGRSGAGGAGAGGAGAGGTGAGGARAGGAGVGGIGEGGAGAGGTDAGGAGVGGTGAGGAGAGGAGAVDPRGAVRPRPYFVPLLQQVLGLPSSTSLPPPVLCPPPDQSQLPLQPASPLPTPSPYSEQTSSLTQHREPASRPVSPVSTARRVPRSRPPPVPGTHAMALRRSSVPLHVPLPAPPESSLPAYAAASALVAEMLYFSAACRLDYATALVAKSAESESASPPSVGGECALGTDVLEDRQEDFECLAAAVPRFASMLFTPEGDPDAPDIPTPRSYAEAITGPYSSQWQAAMDAEMASWKSTGTYIDEVPPPGANIVDGLWIFRVKRLTGSPPAFKARYVARGFSQQQGVDYFQTFSPTPKMTTLRVLLHVAAQRDYELQSLDFSTAFLQGSLHEEIWLCRPPGFTGSFPVGHPVEPQAASLRSPPGASRVARHTEDYTCGSWVLQRFGFQFSSPHPTPLSTGLSLSAPHSDESVEPSGPYPELVGCLLYLMTCTRLDLAYPLSLLARYVAAIRHQKVHWDAAKGVLRYL